MPDFLRLKKSNCKNCYKCIRNCPVKSIRFSGSQAHIVGDECILCGQCFVVCPQNAKEIADSTETARVLLASGHPVIASIAPSFIANYNGASIRSLEKALQKLGFAAAEETAAGATMVKTEYDRMLGEPHREVIITSCCHSINLLIQKYFPQNLKYLADVLSPMQAHGLDIKRRHNGARVVFIGPCLSKKDEAEMYRGAIDCVLTFEELSRWLDQAGVSIEAEPAGPGHGRARLFPTVGGILRSMYCQNEDYTYMAIDGVENCMAALRDIAAGGLRKCFLEMSACAGSCLGGPVMEKYHASPIRDYRRVKDYAGQNDLAVSQPDPMAMRKGHLPIMVGQRQPTADECRLVLHQMGKTQPEHELNCGSCGYNTCRDKAVAVFQGKADLTMCLPFLKDRAERFSDNIVDNSPNGIIVLSENLEVQQINAAARRILNIRNAADVLGEPVVRILDPKPFFDVRANGTALRGQRVYLAEYGRYIEQSIEFDQSYRILICFMRDVTETENERRKKDSISRQTVEIADRVVEKQMRVVQEIASLLGETAAETKIALSRLKASIRDE